VSASVVIPFAVTAYVFALIVFLVVIATILVGVRVLDVRRTPGRPHFALSLEVEGADADGVVAAPGPTTLYVLVPRGIDARWIGAQTAYEPELTAERLPVGEQRVDAWYLRGVLPQVGRDDHPVATLLIEAQVPSEVPIRFRAHAKDLANDEDAAIDRRLVVVGS
jgi:hypothetical protein